MEAPFFGVLLSHKTNMEGPYLKRYGPSILVWETGPKFAGSTASRSPVPLPGMFPPTLNVKLLKVQVLPWSVLLAMAPLAGSLWQLIS
jgi:hypothetical protein